MNFYLTRSQSIYASITILFLFFLAVFLFKPSPPKPKQIATEVSDGQESAAVEFTLDNFVREEIKDGKKIWEIKADKGKYNPANGKSVLKNTQMKLHQKDGGLVELKADNAVLALEGTSGLKSAEFSGNVIVTQNSRTRIETEYAVYDREKNLVSSPNPVKISDERMQLEGIGMEVLVDSKDVKLLKQTQTIIQPNN